MTRSIFGNLAAVWVLALGSGSADAAPAVADGEAGQPPAKGADAAASHPVRASLALEYTTVKPGGTFELGITLETRKGWHTYWDGDNESGMPTKIELKLPTGLKAGVPLWPAPVRYLADGEIVDYVYFDRITVRVPITVDKSVKDGETGEIKADVSWLVCKDGCIPGDASMTIKGPLVKGGEPVKTADAKLFEAARERTPKPAKDAGVRLTTVWKDGELAIECKGAEMLTFMPAAGAARLVDAAKAGQSKGEKLVLSFKPPLELEAGAKPMVRGVLEVKGAAKTEWFEVVIPMAKGN